MNIFDDKQYLKSDDTYVQLFEESWPDQLSPNVLPALDIDQMPTLTNLKRISDWQSMNGQETFDAMSIDTMLTWILPVIKVEQFKHTIVKPNMSIAAEGDDYVVLLRGLLKSSGIYALASVTLPLISLALAPFLTHYLSSTDYGILTILNTFIGLIAGITQLGLGSAFFRAYAYDYTSSRDQRDVLATVTALLCISSIPILVGIAILAPSLASLLFGRPSLGNVVSLTTGVMLLQNLTVPGLSWLRAEKRALSYSLLSIGGLLTTLISSIILVGGYHLGISGSLLATGSGYAFMVICTLPLIVLRAGIKIRADIARSTLAFGLPLTLNFISYWILQLSDRYLLSLFGSLEQTAKYAVVYTIGSAMSVVVIGPFTLAWPTAMFAIAKRHDAAQNFRIVFRWLGLFLLFAAFSFSLVGIALLDWLFPVAYHSAAPIIPIVAESLVFYGIYYIFMAGANITRKTWMAAVFTTLAAIINIILNLFLIPHFGAMGAAISTLFAYMVLASAAYIVNQWIYPVPFEIGTFVVAFLVGIALYMGSDSLAQFRGVYEAWGIHICALCLYGGCLVFLGKLTYRSAKKKTLIDI